ncbi:MAG TPA: thioredoxin family protein, partial [Solirubrobacterales bacterium]|nr:thioredoxin family protein [Solirubrobacterales bacterium]
YALLLGGRRLIRPLARRTPKLQAAMGAIMVVFAIAMFGEYDLRFQNAIASDLPAFLVNPSGELESTGAATDALADIRGPEVSARAERFARDVREAEAGAPPDSGLPVIAPAPEFTGTQQWFNTPGNRPLTLEQLRGRVVLVDFWTYSCINCIRTQPYLKAWDERYRDEGLTIVGVHTPEFPFERDAGNVAEAIERAGLEYPVVQDNEYATWNAYANRYWPAAYFIDARGRVRYTHFGEGDYEKKEEVIRALLAEAGRDPGRARADGEGERVAPGVTTPESYLGSARADRFTDGLIMTGTREYGTAESVPPPDHLAYGGRWRVAPHHATARAGAELTLEFGARRVFLVLGSPGRSRQVRVSLDGEPIGSGAAGADVEGGVVTVGGQAGGQRLYDLVNLPEVGRHSLRLEAEPGVEAYAFTFG